MDPARDPISLPVSNEHSAIYFDTRGHPMSGQGTIYLADASSLTFDDTKSVSVYLGILFSLHHV